MAMDKDRLGLGMWTAVKALNSYGSALTPEADAKGLAHHVALADEIIKEFIGNAEVAGTTNTPNGTPGPTPLPGTFTGLVTA